VRGERLLDGGFSDNLPIEVLGARGADEIIAVVASHRGTALKSPLRTRWRPRLDGRRVHVVHPERPLAIGSWDFTADRIDRAIAEGYRRGRVVAGG
jgi:predicted acylesterase/phospholipase RssA